MALTILPTVPRLMALAADVAFDCRTDSFISGQLVGIAAGGTAADLYGASYDKRKAKRAATIVFPSTDVAAVANGVGIAAATRDAQGNATVDVTITFGTAAGQVIDSLPTFSGTATRLNLAVWVNGRLQQRVADGGNPNPGQFARASATAVVIGADAANPIRVGTEIVIALAEELGVLATMDATTGQYVAGGTVAANTMVERRLGMAKTQVDTAGRSGTALVEADVIVASAGVSLLCITK